MSTLGTPHKPNPPTANDEPSTIPTTASAALVTTLSMTLLPGCSPEGCTVSRPLPGESLPVRQPGRAEVTQLALLPRPARKGVGSGQALRPGTQSLFALFALFARSPWWRTLRPGRPREGETCGRPPTAAH